MDKQLKMIVFYLFLMIPFISSLSQEGKNNYGIKNVLYVSSSHDTYYPSSEILAGAIDHFKEHHVKIDIKTIYLNTRFVQNKDTWRATILTEMNKLIDKQVDLLIVSGPEAITVIDTLDDPRLRNTPVVYCGTFSLKNVRRSNMTGVLFNYRFDEVLGIAEKMFPNLENIYLIGDQTAYSSQLIHLAQLQLSKYSYNYNVIVNSDLNAVNDVLVFLKSLPKNSFVIMLNWQRTRGGDFCDWTIYYPLFAQNSSAPMYRHVRDLTKEEYAIAPNRYLYKHGQEVGAIGVELLKGTPSSQIPIKSPKIGWAASKKWLTDHQIDSRQLPNNVEVISPQKEESGNSRLYFALIIVVAVPAFIFFAQIVFKRKRIRKDAKSIQILKNEVANVLKQFENKHAVLEGVMYSIKDGALIIEPDTNRVIQANPQVAELFNLELKEVIGKRIDEIMAMRQGEIAIDVNGYIRSVVTTGQRIEFTTKEVFVVCRNGKKVPCNGSFSLLSRQNRNLKEVSGILLVINNIEDDQEVFERINTSLRTFHITTWTLEIATQTIVFREGDDPLSRSVGAKLSIETLAQFIYEDQRREFQAFWTDLVRSPQEGLTIQIRMDFLGNGRYNNWQFIGFSKEGKASSDRVVFGTLSPVLSQAMTETQPEYEDTPIAHQQDSHTVVDEENQSKEHFDELRKATILIAEGNDSNFLLMSKLLKDKYHIFRAKNGEQAIIFAKNEQPDLIFMDMNMPVLDGASATKIIRSKDQTTPIYALTASVYDSDKLKTIKAGCTGYLSKPVNKEALFMVIRKHCGY